MCPINTPVYTYVLFLVTCLCLTLCNPMDCSLPASSIHGDSPGKNTGASCHALLQGSFPTQGSNLVSCMGKPLGHGVLCKWHVPSFKKRSGVSWLQPAEIRSSYQTQHLRSTCLSGTPKNGGRGWSMRWLSSLKTFRGMA